MKFTIICFCLFLCCFLSASCQTPAFKFNRINSKDGLSNSSIRCILQDKEGFMWFGTKDGLNRYDGFSFTVFQHNPFDNNTISNNVIRSICEDKHGDLWIATENGLNRFDKKTQTFRVYTHNPERKTISDNNVHYAYEDRNGVLWIGTYKGLNKYNKATDSFTLYQHNSLGHNFAYNSINTIYQDKKGNLWVGTNKGLSRFDSLSGSFTRFGNQIDIKDDLYFNNDIHKICEDKEGNLWLATLGSGLQKFNPVTLSFIDFEYTHTSDTIINNKFILSLRLDSIGFLWIGTQIEGLIRLDIRSGKYTHFKHDKNNVNTIAHNSVTCIYEDRFNVLWVGAYAGGVSKYDINTKPFLLYQHDIGKKNVIADNFVYALYEDPDSSIWVGTPKGLDKLDRETGTFSHINITGSTSSPSENTVHAILKDKTGNLWIGLGGGGLKKLDSNKHTLNTYTHDVKSINSLPHNFIKCIYEDKLGKLWIGTQFGLARFECATDKFISYKSYFDSNSQIGINQITQDNSGQLWLATNSQGLVSLDVTKGVFTRYTPAKSKPFVPKHANYIFIDEKGNLWVSFNEGGLYKFNPSTSSFSSNVLPSHLYTLVIHGIVEDSKGNLWLSSNGNGIFKYNPVTKSVSNYGLDDGLQSNEFNRAFWRGKSGEIYVGGNNGMNIFHPDSIKPNSHPPIATIYNLKVFDQQKSFTDNTITLPYNENYLSFEFAALHYVLPEKNNYAYQLENIDKDWIRAGNRRFVSYSNVAPGKYTFKVKVANVDGIWSNYPASVKVIITPPIWKTTWAYILYSTLFITTIYFARRYIIHQEKLKNDLKFKSLESEKLQEMDQLKSKFFTNISHEFRTPLTLIISPLESVFLQNSKYKEEAELLNTMHRNANRLLQLINQLLDISKMESSTLKVEASLGDIIYFIKAQASNFTSLAESCKLKYTYTTNKDSFPCYFDHDKLQIILSNLLSNAFKFTSSPGEIYLSVIVTPATSHSESFIDIELKDSGIGIEPDKINKIFDRFYQVNNSQPNSNEGSGIGLYLTKELTELLGGTISVVSRFGEGSCFKVNLPLQANLKISKRAVEPDRNYFAHEKRLSVILKDKSISIEEDDLLLGKLTDQTPVLLFIEDNLDLRVFVRSILQEKYYIIEASNGEEGLQKATKYIPNIIISDWMMPGMDGEEVCSRIKNNILTCHIPIIMLTAKATLKDKIQAIKTGADIYITKPFHKEEILVQIENLLLQRIKLETYFATTYTAPVTDNLLPISNTTSVENIDKEIVQKTLNPIEEQFFQKIVSIIEINISDEEFRVETLEKELDISHLQLYRKIKALTNQSPGEFIRNYRLQKATQLLLTGQYTVSQVAYQVGFNNLSYFTKAFRQVYGVTPSQYTTPDNI
ncbi:response regulator [Rhodocytophaga rosea]|uniref:histidine kinase n=2 Tax=Rhodocytophaga rosea TaxID=2704465 RepID=A0A6C0GU55_9BACT|nr:response regulator [Rhodocytophaga rosea]